MNDANTIMLSLILVSIGFIVLLFGMRLISKKAQESMNEYELGLEAKAQSVPDKYDLEVQRLTDLYKKLEADNRRHEWFKTIEDVWINGPNQSILFKEIRPDTLRIGSAAAWVIPGCPTQIKQSLFWEPGIDKTPFRPVVDWLRGTDTELLDFIHSNDFPKDALGIKPENLHLFAEVQRMADRKREEIAKQKGVNDV